MPDPTSELAASLDRLVAAVMRERAALAVVRGDVTASDVQALGHLRQGPLSPGALGRALLLSPSGTTSVVQRLVRAGLAVRTSASANHRNVRLIATRQGLALGAIAVEADVAQNDLSDLVSLIDAIAQAAGQRAADLVQTNDEVTVARSAPDLVRWG